MEEIPINKTEDINLSNQEKLGRLKLENIEVDKNFEEHQELDEEIKKKFIEKGVFPIKKKYIPQSFFRAMKDSNIETHKNQLNTFQKYIDSLVANHITFKSLIRKIIGKEDQPTAIWGNWYGFTMFTSSSDDPGFHIGYMANLSDKSGHVSEFKLKKENPIIIKKNEIIKITEIHPKNRVDLEKSDKILRDYYIDGILYESDGNAIAWVNPKNILELDKITEYEFDDKSQLNKTIVFKN